MMATSKKSVNGPERSNVEYKTCSGGRLPSDLWQTISAFSNTDGGKLYLGVNPDGSSVGLSEEELDKIQQDIASLCDSAFNVAINPIIAVVDDYVIAEIPPVPAQVRPVFRKVNGPHKGTYVRIGSTSRLANEEHLKRFAVAARGGAETLDYTGMHYTAYLDLEKVRSFIDMLNASKDNIYQRFSLEEVLLKQKAINSSGDVTLFGLLAFGLDRAVQEVISPTMNIGITQYPGASKVNESDFTETFTDNREFDGSVKEQFDKAFAFIKTKLPIKGTIDAGGIRREYFVIPEIAIREALANAIAHRDYSSQSSRIQVDIFSNRLEIINPGVSLVPIEELDSAPSTTRNPLLMNFLKEYGITDQKARGIRTIKLSIQKAGLIEPTFENVSQSFKITLSGSAFLSAEDKSWLAQFKSFKLNDRQLNALAHVHNSDDGINNGEYRNINNMTNVRDDKRANRELKTLARLNVLIPVGENKVRRYVLSDKYSD